MISRSLTCVAVAFFASLAASVRAEEIADPPNSFSNVIHLDLLGTGPGMRDEAPSTELAVGVGYAHLSIGGSGSVLDGEDLLRFEPVFAVAPFAKVPEIRLGFALGVGLDFENTGGVIISNGQGLFVSGSTDIPFWTLEPEFRLSWRQYFSEERGFFVEPGVAVGLIYAHLDLEDADGNSHDTSDTSVFGRVFLNAGYRSGPGTTGLQISYMAGDSLHMADNADGSVEEFYIGFFGSIKF